MNFLSRQQQSNEQKINDIITAFGTYALGDIENNIKHKMPVSAFLLCSCWIDQVALFVYNHNEENLDQHYKNFIEKYLPKYKEMDLYTNLRCKLVHSYSLGANTRIHLESHILDKSIPHTNINEITAPTLLHDLKIAWETVKSELLDINSLTRENALKRFDISPTIIEAGSGYCFYTKEEAEFLVLYYQPRLKGKLLNNKPTLRIYTIDKYQIPELQNQYVLLVIVKQSATIKFCEYLERVTDQFNLPFPMSVLPRK